MNSLIAGMDMGMDMHSICTRAAQIHARADQTA